MAGKLCPSVGSNAIRKAEGRQELGKPKKYLLPNGEMV
jgi:hypothetical protein